MDTPRYTITRDRDLRSRPWILTRLTANGGDYIIGRCETHAEAVDAVDWLLAGRAYGHTLVVGEDPAAARRRALKARRMAARRRARPVAPVYVWEPVPARLERAAGEWGALVRSATSATRAEFTLAVSGGDA